MRLQDKYEVLCELGRGGFGVVYLVREPTTGEQFAAKVLLDEEDRHAFRLLAREVKQLLRYNSIPHVMRLVGEYLSATPPFFLMPYAPGGNALKHIGKLTERQVLTIMRQLLETLMRIHATKGFHRDIKPENILFLADGTAALGDFGLGSSPEITVNFTVSPGGTAGYAAPEIVAGGAYTTACDIYSAGATWFHFLVNRHPKGFLPPLDPRSVRSDIRMEVAALVVRMTSSDPAERPTANEVHREVTALLEGKDERLPIDLPEIKHINWEKVAKVGGLVLVPLAMIIAFIIYLATRSGNKQGSENA